MLIMQETRADWMLATTRPPAEISSSIKIIFKEFSGEPEDWTTWSRVHRVKLSALGCADALTETAGEGTTVNCDYFHRSRPRSITQDPTGVSLVGCLLARGSLAIS